jgi:hypothetical protein
MAGARQMDRIPITTPEASSSTFLGSEVAVRGHGPTGAEPMDGKSGPDMLRATFPWVEQASTAYRSPLRRPVVGRS